MTRFAHVNLVAADVDQIVKFYTDVLDCVRLPRSLSMSGPWLDELLDLQGVAAHGVHLKLPGFDENGPTIEVLSYGQAPALTDDVRRPGWGHIAFEVDNVPQTVERVIEHGGTRVGATVTTEIVQAGTLTVAYTRDPEGNVVELQHWERAQ